MHCPPRGEIWGAIVVLIVKRNGILYVRVTVEMARDGAT